MFEHRCLALSRYTLGASINTLPEILDPSESCKKSSARAVDGTYGPGYSLALIQDLEQKANVHVVEDNISLKDKVRLVAAQDLGGILLAGLSDDDFSGSLCMRESLRVCLRSQMLILIV